MANILVNSEKDVEIAAQDALKWLSSASKSLTVAPSVVAALGTLFGQLETPIAAIAGVTANPLNIALDVQTVNDLKSVWPDIKTFLTSIGVKL